MFLSKISKMRLKPISTFRQKIAKRRLNRRLYPGLDLHFRCSGAQELQHPHVVQHTIACITRLSQASAGSGPLPGGTCSHQTPTSQCRKCVVSAHSNFLCK